MFVLFFCNTRTCVTDHEADGLAVRLNTTDGDTSFLRVFVGIVKQFGEHLQQATLIGDDMQTVGHMMLHFQCDGIRIAECDGLCSRLADFITTDVIVPFHLINTLQGQCPHPVVDDIGDGVAVLHDIVGNRRYLRLIHRLMFITQHLGKSSYNIKRCTDLV